MNISRTLTRISTLSAAVISFQLFAQQQVSESLEANPDGIVKIEHVNGRAEIFGWDKNQVQVEGELGDRTEEFTFERKGNSIHIIVEVESQSRWNKWGDYEGDDLKIFVPRQSSVDYTSVNADVEMGNITGGTDIEVVNGDIKASELSGKVRLETVNGDINAQNISGDLKIDTVNGDIMAKHLDATDLTLGTVNGDIEVDSDSPEIRAESVNGDIELDLDRVDEVETSTVNGSIEIEMALNEGADIRASSVGGSIELTFEPDVSARFDIEAHAGGSIKNSLTDDKMSKAEYGPRRWLKFETRDANAQVDISTVHGTVRLKKD